MKATGEVMAIGQTFEEAILKAVRGAEIGVKNLNLPIFEKENSENGKYIFEGVWFRSQNEVNRNQSLWTDDSCNRRRTIH